MNSDPHVDVNVSRPSQIRYVANHSQAQVDAVLRVSSVFNRHAGYAVVAVAQKLYAQYIMFLHDVRN